MDIALIKEIFRNYESTVNVLEIKNDSILKEIKEKNIPPFPIGKDGRLMEWSEKLKKYIDTMFKNSTYPNLLDSHPPFQIDGNFGFTSGVANALIQSRNENGTYIIDILPAKPKE